MTKYMAFKDWLVSVHGITIEQYSTQISFWESVKLVNEYWRYADKCVAENTSN